MFFALIRLICMVAALVLLVDFLVFVVQRTCSEAQEGYQGVVEEFGEKAVIAMEEIEGRVSKLEDNFLAPKSFTVQPKTLGLHFNVPTPHWMGEVEYYKDNGNWDIRAVNGVFEWEMNAFLPRTEGEILELYRAKLKSE